MWTAWPEDADRYLAVRCKGRAKNTLVGKAHGIAVFFQYLELRHAQTIWQLTGDRVACPLDELNTPASPGSSTCASPPTDQWIATTMGYVHVHRSHVEDSWQRAAERSARRLGPGMGMGVRGDEVEPAAGGCAARHLEGQ